MKLWVYEVELKPHAKGQVFQQHVIAASPKQARELVEEKQGRPAIRTSVRRPCTEDEVARWVAEHKK